MPDHPLDIESMSDLQLDERLWDHLVTVDEAWSEPWLAGMAPLVKAYVATTSFEFTVGNGGLAQFFENSDGSPWLIPAVIEGYRFLGLDDVAQAIAEEILPVASSPSEQQLRERVRRGASSLLMEGSALNALDHLIEDHTALRVRLIRADPVAFGLPRPSGSAGD